MTLLFLPAVGLRRTCDLRGYSGDALALLTGRRRAYGYWQVERFLSQVAQAGGDERVTSALAQWTDALWPGGEPEPLSSPWYLDGHKKPVLNEDLTRLCERVSQAAPGLPDGRHLLFTVGTIRRPILGPYKRRVA